MALLAITVLGHDRPGIIADATAALARREVNVEDSAMTLLGGFFAWTLVVGTPVASDDIAADLAFLESDDLVVTVFPVTQQPVSSASAVPFVISVHGADRVGIVSTMTAAIAERGGNVTDLATRLGGGLFIVIAEADFPPGTDADVLRAGLKEVGATVGVDVSVQPAETDVL
jgi:glycine cleavage system transcriptional repressor